MSTSSSSAATAAAVAAAASNEVKEQEEEKRNSHTRSAAAAAAATDTGELLLQDFMESSCSKRQLLSSRVKEIQMYSSNKEAVQNRLDESCRRMFQNKVEDRITQFDENLAKLTRQMEETASLLDEFHACQISQQHLFLEISAEDDNDDDDDYDYDYEHKAEMQTLIQECGTEIRNLEQVLSSHQKTMESLRNDREKINVDEMRQTIWRQYMSKRKEMVQTSMMVAAQDYLPQAQTELAQHDANVKTQVDQLLHHDEEQPSGSGSGDGSGGTGTAAARAAAAAASMIKTSHVLHVCAAHLVPEYIDLMLDFLSNNNNNNNTENDNNDERLDALNLSDEHGFTPLMAAVVGGGTATITTTTTSSSSLKDDDSEEEEQQQRMRYQMVQKLIRLGADKNRKDLTGKTALNLFRDRKRQRGMMEDAGEVDAETSQQQQKQQQRRENTEPSLDMLLEALLQPSSSDDSSERKFSTVE